MEADVSYLPFIPVWKTISAAERFGSLKCLVDCLLRDIPYCNYMLFL